MKRVAIALVVVAVGLVVGAIALLREPGERVTTATPADGRADRESGRPNAAPAPASADTSADPSRASDPAAADAGLARALDPYRGDGSIMVRVVDAADGEPLADLPLIVWSERPQTHVYARAITDEHGEATIRELPEDVVIFETPRRPPHANAIFATWLVKGRHQRVEMRVGRGGTVRGRVVDDLGTPIRDAEVLVDVHPGGRELSELVAVQAVDADTARRFARTPQVAAKTGADGRFELTGLLSRASAIWIEDGEMSPKRTVAMALSVRHGFATTWFQAQVAEGEVVDVPDVVIPRERIYAGRVLDHAGAGVAGALVSARNERRLLLGQRGFEAPLLEDVRRRYASAATPDSKIDFSLAPWEDGFELAAWECVTAADGSFELAVLNQWPAALVVGPTLSSAFLPLPQAAPGSRTEGLEVRLPLETQLIVDVTDPDGAPLRSPKSPESVAAPRVVATRRDGSVIEQSGLRRRTETEHALFLLCAPEELGRLVVTAPDHRSASCDFATPPSPRSRVAFSLQPKRLHSLAFRFRIADVEEARRLAEVSHLTLRASLESTLGRARGSDAGTLAQGSLQPAKSLEVTLLVPIDRKFCVEIDGPFGGGDRGWGPLELGWFTPGDEVNELELPRVSAAWLAAKEADARERAEREKRRTEAPKWGMVRLEVADAVTGALLEADRFYPRLTSPKIDGVGARPDRSRGTGSSVWWFPSGPCTFHLRAMGYRESTDVNVTVLSEETVDAGRILLEPLPQHRLRLRQRDGSPPSERLATWLQAGAGAGAGDDRLLDGSIFQSDAEGIVVLVGDLPDEFLFVVATSSGLNRYGSLPQAFAGRAWPIVEVAEFELAPWRQVRVHVDLAALEPDLRESGCTVRVQTIGDRWTATFGSRALGTNVLDGTSLPFEFTAPPGRYELRVTGAVILESTTPIEVQDVDEPQKFTIVASGR